MAKDIAMKDKKAIRLKAIAEKGGKCERCGYDRCTDALEFHKIDPKKKGLSNNLLLCANCHREIHVKVKSVGIANKVDSGKTRSIH